MVPKNPRDLGGGLHLTDILQELPVPKIHRGMNSTAAGGFRVATGQSVLEQAAGQGLPSVGCHARGRDADQDGLTRGTGRLPGVHAPGLRG